MLDCHHIHSVFVQNDAECFTHVCLSGGNAANLGLENNCNVKYCAEIKLKDWFIASRYKVYVRI